MGLDMYAYVASKGQHDQYYEDLDWQTDVSSVSKPREIAYWRKHPNLHGWMERLAEQKNLDYDSFNGVELELTWEDLEALEQDIRDNALPATTGFFFGNNSDEHYREDDLEFVRKAKAEIFLGLKVFYNSSW